MKFRQGVVSNSSSTSFTCEICQDTYSGYDGDYGMDVLDCGGCGYTFCRSHFDDLKFDHEECSKCALYDDCKEDLEPGEPCMGMDCYSFDGDVPLPDCPIC